jgi:hypothetical protein
LNPKGRGRGKETGADDLQQLRRFPSSFW